MSAVEQMETGDGGRCFEHALDVLVHCPPIVNGRKVTEKRLVHGTPIGTGPLNGGFRYWHAWVEVRVRDIGWLVLDGSKNPRHPICTTRENYYRFGRLNPAEHVWRYTTGEAGAEGQQSGHAGPWVPDEETHVEI